MNERLERLAEDLRGTVENLVLLEAVDSTHAMARRLITDMDEEDQNLGATLILAERQSRGEGRGDRRWESPGGGLFLSWLASGIEAETVALLPILAASAAHGAVTRIGISDARIKWPNDILVAGKKLAGILVFARHGESNWVTVGLGINLQSAPVLDHPEATPATSVAEHLGEGDLDTWRHSLTCTFVRELDSSIDNPGPAIEAWQSHLVQRPGDSIRVRLASGKVITGSLIEITPEGFLRVQEPDGERIVTGGDVIES